MGRLRVALDNSAGYALDDLDDGDSGELDYVHIVYVGTIHVFDNEFSHDDMTTLCQEYTSMI